MPSLSMTAKYINFIHTSQQILDIIGIIKVDFRAEQTVQVYL